MKVLDDKIQELIALGASYAVNCRPCMEYHHKTAEKAGVTKEEMLAAIAVGEKVRNGATHTRGCERKKDGKKDGKKRREKREKKAPLTCPAVSQTSSLHCRPSARVARCPR